MIGMFVVTAVCNPPMNNAEDVGRWRRQILGPEWEPLQVADMALL